MEVKKREGIGGWRRKGREKSLSKRRRKSSAETIKIE